ncbi:hypothetical protein Taro_018336 [Colocasia esculenta]|uniref:Uncharacterized protein n=1 Tax=Colocasia esculenta TaxID=4460 RepID=A0A843UTJ7_COLES|nr:hypothetical protein [Colocasia esculenta]
MWLLETPTLAMLDLSVSEDSVRLSTGHTPAVDRNQQCAKFQKSGSSVEALTVVKCVDTVPGSVDTRPSFQKTQLPDWDSVSTQPVAVSTLDPASRRPFLDKWDNVSTHSVVVSTHSG